MKTGIIEDVLRDMESGVFDFTVDGACSNCGECCSDFLPISQGEIARIKAYIRKHDIKAEKHFLPTVKPTLDMTCPFRDNAERRCKIYPIRPAICRDFRCDKPKQQIWADKQKYHGLYAPVSMRNTFFREGT